MFPTHMKIELIAFNCRYTHSCLALFYVRNELEKRLSPCSVSIEQFTINDPYFETLLRISTSDAEALFFSVYIWNSTYLSRLLADLHAIKPDTPLVLGGPQALALRETLTFSPTVVHHEIEGVDPCFFVDLQKRVLKKDYKGSPVKIFDYPYKQEDFTSQLKNRNIYYEASRGCPFYCAYCLSSVSHGVRAKDLSIIKSEIVEILKLRPSMIRFVDRTFNADPQKTLDLWKFLQNESDNCLFHFEVAPDLFTEEMFQFLEGAPEGKFQFEIGIQSTNKETLAAVNRKMDVQKSLATLKRLKGIGTIHLHVDLILGLPMETEESFANSIRDVLRTEPHQLQMGLLKVLPATAIAEKAEYFGITACQAPPYQVMKTRWMEHKTLSKLYWIGECIESFYNKGYFKNFFSFCIKEEIDIYSFFYSLAKECEKHGFFELAKTQKLMNDILYYFINSHNNNIILTELLIYDWLMSGHRFIPDVFKIDINDHRELIWKLADTEIDGLYTVNEKNFFFKKGIFFKFSMSVLTLCGYKNIFSDSYVGFFKDDRCSKTEAKIIPC